MLVASSLSAQEAAGSIRGVVYDRDFEVPLAGATVTIQETGQEATTGQQGNYVLHDVPPGTYTLGFDKGADYHEQVRGDVVVLPGRLTEVDVRLSGEFHALEEYVVPDVALGGGTETQLLDLRFESPALMDSISSELMSRAGASDAASALRLVAGASVQEGKFAVIRGLPDRYVSNQMNGVRLPTADEDKRAVELDQFPSPVIESVQVTKTFTPDQQGDASGGAVDVTLKGVPEETSFRFSFQVGANTQVVGADDFLTYEGGGLNFWGRDDGREIQLENIGDEWDGAVGVATIDPPADYKWSLSGGGKHTFDDGVRIGGFASVFYERDSSHFDDGVDDGLWVVSPGDPLTPQTVQGTPQDGDFKTRLFDVVQSSESVQWGGLGTFGVESEDHALGLTYLYTRSAEDTATLATDTRGKEFFFPGYDMDDPTSPGNLKDDLQSAPQLRTETLEYTERTTRTVQLRGEHTLPIDGFGAFRAPVLDWTLAQSDAGLDQPDKRQFGALFHPESYDPEDDVVDPPVWRPFKPAANFNLGNLQRIFKTITEESSQYSIDLRFPFEQWNGREGFLEVGVFDDDVERRYEEETFSNFGDSGASFEGGFDEPWSGAFPFEDDHPITESTRDIDYEGSQDVSAWYSMLDLPLSNRLELIGGARVERTEIGIFNEPEGLSEFFPPGATAPVKVAVDPDTGLTNADVLFEQDDVLPAVALVYEASDAVTLRASYAETIARQTFKELTPIIQQEFLGGPIFIGNPELEMSALRNYDARLDYAPYEGSLVSASLFHKDVEDPIEYVQRPLSFTFTTPVNYPEGRLSGIELEARQDLGRFWDPMEGFGVGANATFIDSEVELPEDEVAAFEDLDVPIRERDMTNAPDHLYNLYLTYDFEETGTQLGLFYTMQGDTLLAGAGESKGNFVPSVYQEGYDTLDFSLSQRLGERFGLKLQAKNLTNPTIEEVYRSPVTDEATHRSHTRGIEFTIGFSVDI